MPFFNHLKEHYTQLLYTLFTYPEAVRFMRKYKVWSGFWKYSWVSKLLVLVAILAGLKFIATVTDWFQSADTSDPLAAMSSVGTLLADVASREYEYLTSGSMRYLMIILLEIVIFHVSRRTVEILTAQTSDSRVKAFIDAQIRMIKVAFFCYVMEMILGIGLKVFLGFFSFLEFTRPALLFGVQVFFMGFAVMDNYMEQFGFRIKESFRFSLDFIGVGLGTGLSLQLLFLVPVLGPLIAPFLATVTATITLYELTDLHRQIPEAAPQAAPA